MGQDKVELNTISFNAAISACEKGDEWQRALGLLESMGKDIVKLSTVSYSAAISACGKGDAWQHALALFSEVQRCGLQQNRITYTAALSACGVSGQWEWAMALIRNMHRNEFSPSGMNVGAVANALVQVGRVDHARLLLENFRAVWSAMPEDGKEKRMSAAPGNEQGPLMEHVAAETEDSEENVLEEGGVAKNSSAIRDCMHPAMRIMDSGIVAVSKPPGVESELALGLLQQQLSTCGSHERVTSVSRLDHLTSGVLIAALGSKSSGAAHWLIAQFAGRLTAKEYLCLCVGESFGPLGVEGVSTSRLHVARIREDTWRVRVSLRGKIAQTRFKLLCMYMATGAACGAAFSLLLVRPMTGRTQLIRAHLASIGRTPVGDWAYGADAFPCETSWCPRLFLHCRRVEVQDLTGNPFVAEEALPLDLVRATEQLVRVEEA
jgi:pentatricopeptide repeat protein